MIDDIKRFFTETLVPEEGSSDTKESDRGIEHATAALLIELAKTDFERHSDEEKLIIETLTRVFDLDKHALNELIDWAENATDEAHDLYQFTSLVNDHYGNQDKRKLLQNLWKVAFADGRIDRYEEHFIRRVTGLLNLAHSDFIKAKIAARDGG